MLFHSYRPFAKILKYKMKLSLLLNTIILLFFIFLLNSCLLHQRFLIVFENQSNETLTIITNKRDLFEFIQTRVRKSGNDTIVFNFNFSKDINKDSIWTSSVSSIFLSNKHIKNLNDLRNILKDSAYVRFEDLKEQIFIEYNPDFGKLIKSDTLIVLPRKYLKLEYERPIDKYWFFNEMIIYKGSENHQIIIKDEAIKRSFNYRCKKVIVV